jgi:hypothetical protein
MNDLNFPGGRTYMVKSRKHKKNLELSLLHRRGHNERLTTD